MTPPKIAVIATRLPYVDRRSLSQAWFSALHLASDGPRRAPFERRGPLERAAGAPLGPIGVRSGAPRATAPRANASAGTAPRTARSTLAALEAATRLRADTRTARAARESFERARSYPPFRTSLTFGVDGERVHLLLRREGATLHVVALCRPELADTVRRALACADAHVRVRGESVRSTVEIVAAETGATGIAATGGAAPEAVER